MGSKRDELLKKYASNSNPAVKTNANGNRESGTAQNTSGKSSSVREKMLAKYSPRQDSSAIDDDYISKFLSDVNDYFGRARSDYNGISYSTANSAYDSHNKEISDLLGRSRAIRSYLRDNRGSYSKEDYDQFNTQLHKINTALSGYSDAFFNVKKQMSKFGSEEEYNTARKNYEWQQKYKDSSIEDLRKLTLDDEEEQKWVKSYIQYLDDEEKGNYDLVAGQKEIDDLKAQLAQMEQDNRYNDLQQRINPAKPTEPTRQDIGYNPHTMWQQGTVQTSGITEEEKLRQLIAQKQQYLNQAKHIQESNAYADTVNNADFDQFDDFVESYDVLYNWINDAQFREEFESLYKDSPSDVNSDSRFTRKNYDQINENEIAIFNYYYAKGGKKAAKKYLDNIQETLNKRKAEEVFGTVKDNVAAELVFGVAAGVNQFGTNVMNNFKFKADYIPQSAYQIASGMVREDLADNGKLPEWLGGGSLGQVAYDAITTTANMAPSILVGIATGGTAGTALMGLSAAGGAYQQALNEGFDKAQARGYSILVGASEAVLEKVLGGISAVGGNALGRNALKNLANADNAFKAIAKILGASAWSEFKEEYLQEILDPVFRNLMMHTGEDVMPVSAEAIYSGILGALTGAFMEAPFAIYSETKTASTGRKIKEAGSVNDLAKIGNTFAPETVAYKLAGKVTNDTGAYTIGQLFNEVNARLTDQNISEIAEVLMKEGMGENEAKQNARNFAYVVEGGTMPDAFAAAIEADTLLASAARQVLFEDNTTWNQRSQGYRDVLMKLADDKVKGKTAPTNEASVPADNTAEAKTESGAEGNVEPAKYGSIQNIKNGKVTVKMTDGSEVDLKDADLDPEDSVRIETIASIDGISAEDASGIFNILKAGSKNSQYDAIGAREAYRYGYYGLTEKMLDENGTFSKSLTLEQRKAVYEMGKKARDASVTAETGKIKQMRETADQKEPAKLRITYNQGNGSVRDIDGKTITGLSRKQRAAVSFAKVLHQLGVGTDFEFFESYLSKTLKDKNGNRARVFLDDSGNEVIAYSGVYQTADGKIRIDLNAYSGRGLALNAMSHELVHFIKQWSPDRYRTMADIVGNAYGNTQMSMHQRVLREQARLNRIRGTEVSYDEAYDEVVANALNRMLDDGTVLDRIAEIRKVDGGLADMMIDCIRKFIKRFAKVFSDNESLFYDTEDLMQFKDTVEELRGMFAEALVEASDNRLSSVETEAVESLGENATVETNEDGQLLLAKNESGNVLMYSEQTYQMGGRDKLKAALKQNGHTAEEINETLSFVDDALDYIKILAAGYAKNMGYTKLSNHLVADIVTNVKTGKQVMSSIVNNGDYPVNIDLSLICKKRVAYMNLMSRLIRDGVFDKVNYDGAAIAEVNGILRENGFETACLGCFVESRRLQFQAWAETIVSEWNSEVEKRNPNAKHFGFAKGKMEALTDADINALTAELESVKKNDQGNVNLGQGNSVTRMGRLLDALPSLQMKLTVEDLLTPEGLTALRKHDGSLFSIVKSRYGAASPKIVQDFNPYASEIAMLTFAQVKGITNNAVKGAQAYVTEVKREYGRPKKANGESREDFNQRKKDHEQRVQDEAMRRYLYDIGGARIQSFSDFMIENVFDYIQIFADLSAKRLPLHGYSKEIVCLRLFGMTGAKWNGSLIAHVERSMGKEFAGLLPAGTKDGIPVNVDGKEYVIGFDDYARNASTGGKSFIQSIGMKDIIALQLDPRYSPYVGNITIGVSDAQIMAMLDNPLFRMVIPYHASGMLPMFAKLVGVDMYNDYTDYQNTTIRQYYDVDGNAVSELKNAKGEAVKADTSFAFNAEIQKTKDAKTAADNYLRWCAQRHPVYDGKTLVGYATFNPKFSSSPYGNDFTRHENYYKLLEDFNTYDSLTEESAVQGAVTMNFPSEENRLTPSQMEAYKKALRETGIFSEKDIEKYAKKADMTFKEIINAEVGNRANYEVTQAPKWESTVKAVEEKLQKDYAREQYSSQETDADQIKRKYWYPNMLKSEIAEVKSLANNEAIPISHRFNDENKDLRYSTQETDNITARDLLSGTDVATIKNEVAKKKLADYQKILEVMNAEDQKLREIRAEIKELSFAKGARDTKKLKDLKFEAIKINNHISVYEGQLQRMEKELQSVVKRERAKVVKEVEKRDKAVLAKEWMDAQVKQSETLREYRETRAALRQQESDTAVMEKEFIRITKEYEKLDAKSGKTISELRTKLKNEAKKHRADEKMWMAEFGRLMREYDAADRSIDRLEQKIERQKAVAKERVEGRNKTAMRHKIRKIVKDLDKILNRGNKKNNVKEDMKGFASKALELADYLFADHISNEDLIRKGITVRMTTEEAALVKETENILFQLYDNADNLTDAEFNLLDSKRKRNLDKLRDLLAEQRNEYLDTPVYNLFNDLVTEYASLKNSTQDAVRSAYNPDIERFLRSYIGDSADGTDTDRKTLLQNMRVKDMTMDELWKIHNAYTMVLHSIRKANEMFVKGKAESVDEVTKAITWDFGSRKIPDKKAAIIARNLSNKIGWDYEKLYYALDRIGSEAFTELVMNVANSENTVMQDVMEAAAFRDQMVEQYGFNNWDVNKEIDREFLDTTGKKFKLTLGQMMALYAYSRREGAWDHIEYGGFVFGDAALTNPRPADAYKLSKEQCEAITNLLTEEQKGYVKSMQRFLSETMGEKGNEVSMLMYGIKMFNEKNYFPIHMAGQFKAQANESQAKAAAGFQSMSNAGFTHAQNPNAKAPFVLEGFNEVWVDHVNEMSRYHGTVPALEDMRRVMNRSTYSNSTESSVSIKQLMENSFGKEAVEYFDDFYREANAGAITDKLQKRSQKLLSLFRKNSVAYSLSVLIQQPTSITRAYAMIDPRYFGYKGVGAITGGVVKTAANKWTNAQTKAYNEMLKYAPGVTMAKEIGGFDTATGGSIRSYLLDTNKSFKQKWKTGTALEKGKAVMDLVDDNAVANLPNLADKIAWIEIWNACKRESLAKHTNLRPSSDELLQIAGKRFTEVIRATQVYDSMFAKSPMLKSKNLFVQSLVSFMNEPNTVANMAESAMRDFVRGDKKSGVRKAAVLVNSIIATGVLKSIVYAMRDDDEDETYIEKYVEAITGSLMDDFNLLNYIPIARDVWSLTQGYDVERADMAIVADAIEALGRVIKNASTETGSMTEEQLIEFDKQCTEANWKLAESLATFLGIPMKNIRREIMGILNLARTSSANKGLTTKTSLSDSAYNAVIDSIPFLNGKKTKDEKLYEALMKGDEQYASRLASSYKDEKAASSAVAAAIKNRYKNGKLDEATALKHLVLYAGKDGTEAHWTMDKWKYQTQKGTDEGYSKYYKIYEAIKNGESITEAVEEHISNGSKENEVMSEVKSSIGEWYRKGEITKKEATDMLTDYFDLDSDEIEATIQKWSSKVDTGIAYDDIKTEYMDGNITSAQAVDMYVKYGGYTKEDAEETIADYDFENEYGFSYSNRVTAYKEGIVSSSEMKSILMEHGNLKETDAEDTVKAYEFLKNHQQYDLDVNDAKKFTVRIGDKCKDRTLTDFGVSVESYLEYVKGAKNYKGVDADGDGYADRNTKAIQLFDMIDKLPISSTAKDGLAYITNAKGTINKYAPWHQ